MTTTAALVTQRDLARACAASPRTVRRWMRAGMPGGKSGPWDVELILQWVRRMRSAGARRGLGAMEVRVGDEPAPLDAVDNDGAGDDVLPADGANGDEIDVDPGTLDSRGLDRAAKVAATRFRVARARREELMLQQLAGSLIERGIVEKLLVERSTALRRDLLSIGRRLAPIVVGLDLRDTAIRIADAHRALLATYSRPAEIG